MNLQCYSGRPTIVFICSLFLFLFLFRFVRVTHTIDAKLFLLISIHVLDCFIILVSNVRSINKYIEIE